MQQAWKMYIFHAIQRHVQLPCSMQCVLSVAGSQEAGALAYLHAGPLVLQLAQACGADPAQGGISISSSS